MSKHWWVVALLGLGGLVFVALLAGLNGALARNMYALQVKRAANGIEWTNEFEICRPSVPPPTLVPRACSGGADCYLSGVLALRRREWDNVQTSLGTDPDPLSVFVRGWSDRCNASLDRALATWRSAAAPIRRKFLAEAEAALIKGDAASALTKATIAHELGATAQSFLALASAQAALGHTPLALETYYRAIEQNMATARTYGQVGALESQLRIDKSARVHLAQAVRLDPSDWHYWQLYGSVLFRLEDWAASASAFARAAELAPEFGAAHGGVALAQLRRGKLQEGRAAVAATMQYTSDVRQQAGYLGEFARYAAAAGDLKWSAELYSRALGRMPAKEVWWHALAGIYARMGDCAKMRSVYRSYVELMNALAKKPAPQPACPA